MSENGKIVQGLYDAFARGDVEAVLGTLAEDCKWTEAAGFPYAGTYTGPQAVLENVFMPLGADWDGFKVAPDAVVDGGDDVVATGTYSGTYKATGKPFEARFAHHWTLQDGKAVRFEQFVDSAKVQEALV